MMDWLGKMLNLPDFFLASSGGMGGGVIQGTASESTLVTLLTAKNKKIKEIKNMHPDWSENLINSKLVLYCSEQVNIILIFRKIIFKRNISSIFYF
jgi:aromatic-L-amino-acid decarboxylase